MTEDAKKKLNEKVEKRLARLAKILEEERRLKIEIHQLYAKLFEYGRQ